MSNAQAGYTYDSGLAPSPVSTDALAELHASVLWTDGDAQALRRAAKLLMPHSEEILDVWYGFVAANPHLVATFAGPNGEPDDDYQQAVRGRFGKWIEDLCTRDHDETWLAYQEEIARRHHPEEKNRTDGVQSTSPHVPMRHLLALTVPITLTVREFLAAGGDDVAEVDAMHNAWFKAVTLSAVLWTRPYAPELW